MIHLNVVIEQSIKKENTNNQTFLALYNHYKNLQSKFLFHHQNYYYSIQQRTIYWYYRTDFLTELDNFWNLRSHLDRLKVHISKKNQPEKEKNLPLSTATNGQPVSLPLTIYH